MKLLVDLPDEAMSVYADRDRIHQVIINLLNNSFKYTEEGHVKISAAVDGGRVMFSVCDTGRGIPEEDRDKVFELFYQVQDENQRSSAVFGTGLGLAICKQIISHYGGKISVSDNEDGGCCFSFTLGRYGK